MKRVSVIMPTCKRDVPYISRAVQSLRNQTYDNLEIIIIDDSPKNYSKRANIKKYIESLKDERIIYIQNEENLGGALARNKGIFKSTGEYITFLDDDDEYKPDKVLKQVNFMENNDYDLIFSNMEIKNSKGAIIDIRDYHDIWSFENEEFLKYHLIRHATGTPTYMFKAEKLKQIGGFDHAIMGQEFYLMLKAIENGFKIGYFDEYDVVVYRHKGEAISTGKNKIKGEKILQEKKKEYFHILSNEQIRFINMRHYAVLAVASKRNKKYLSFLGYSFVAFSKAPIACTREAAKFMKTVIINRVTLKKN
ncbi:MAG: glycosyltransferase family 2 protein [Lagierella massiliensis]|nr:glycosyltransferase family 2 protein [Lagierella massiliensis]